LDTVEGAQARVFVGIGEVLSDVFEDGTEALGGAPLNVAVHAHQLAEALGIGQGAVVSCVGRDARGARLVSDLHSRGMTTKYIGSDPVHPTGHVSVLMHNGEPGYQIATGVAWDFIPSTVDLDELAATCEAVCFGSLAQRSPVSRATILRFLGNAGHALRLFDINLRRNTLSGEEFYDAGIIESSCRLATMIKANASELILVCRLLGIDSSLNEDEAGLRRGAEMLLSRFPAEAVVVTQGALGAAWYGRKGEARAAVIPVAANQLHPVGAGDASSAAILVGCSLGWEPPAILELANRMGAWVASQIPATPPLGPGVLAFARDMRRAYTHT